MLHRRDLPNNSKLFSPIYAKVFLSIYRGEIVDHAKLKEIHGLNLSKSTWSEKIEFLIDNKFIERTLWSRHPNRQEYGTCYSGCLEYYFEKIFKAPDWKSPYINPHIELFKYNFKRYLKNYQRTESLFDIFTGFAVDLGGLYNAEMSVQLWRTRKLMPKVKRKMLKLLKKQDFSQLKTNDDIIDKFTGLGNNDSFTQEAANIIDEPTIHSILSGESSKTMKSSTNLDLVTWTIFMWLCHQYHSEKVLS